VQKRLVLVCEDSLCHRKKPDVSGPGLGEAGRYRRRALTAAATSRKSWSRPPRSTPGRRSSPPPFTAPCAATALAWGRQRRCGREPRHPRRRSLSADLGPPPLCRPWKLPDPVLPPPGPASTAPDLGLGGKRRRSRQPPDLGPLLPDLASRGPGSASRRRGRWRGWSPRRHCFDKQRRRGAVVDVKLYRRGGEGRDGRWFK